MDANEEATPPPTKDRDRSGSSPPVIDISAPETPTPTAPPEYGWMPQHHLDYMRRVHPTPKLPPSTDPGPPLRYRRTPFWLAAIYLISLIVPWVLMCVLDKKPVTAPSYYYQKSGVSKTALDSTLIFVSVFRAISAVMVVPITSIILGHAAVTFSQRQNAEQKLNMRQLFVLVDRGWADVVTLWNSKGHGSSSRLLWVGAALILLGGIQQPLQSALVFFEPTAILTCADLPIGGCDDESDTVTVGFDAEPWGMELADNTLIVEEVVSNLGTVSDSVEQEYLWVDDPHADNPVGSGFDEPMSRSSLYWYSDDYYPDSTFFVTSLANGTETGVLREHALRLSSEITCKNVTRSEFPSPCPGEQPIYTEVNMPGVELRVCVPGEFGRHPWSRTRNREDITENLYLDFHRPKWTGAIITANFTMHCMVTSTRGYFELGNVMNGQTYGPLMDKWPSPETVVKESSDYTVGDLPFNYIRPGERDNGNEISPDYQGNFDSATDVFGVGRLPPAGPLMTSAIALFGNNSFLHPIADNSSALSPGQALTLLCQHSNIPFTQVTKAQLSGDESASHCRTIPWKSSSDDYEESAPDILDAIITSWLGLFEQVEDAEYLLMVSSFLANKAVLRQAAMGAGYRQRPIYHSPGTLVNKPRKAIASTVVISVLILLEVIGLAAMVRYVNSVPTWTSHLDAMAVASIGRAMGEGEVLSIGPFSEMDRHRLRGVDAVIGIVDDETKRGESPTLRGSSKERGREHPDLDRPLMESDSERGTNATSVRFGLGARGVISRDSVPERPTWMPLRKRKKRKEGKVMQK